MIEDAYSLQHLEIFCRVFDSCLKTMQCLQELCSLFCAENEGLAMFASMKLNAVLAEFSSECRKHLNKAFADLFEDSCMTGLVQH